MFSQQLTFLCTHVQPTANVPLNTFSFFLPSCQAQSVSLSMSFFGCLSVCLCPSLSVCLSFTVCMSLSACLYVYVSLSLCLPVYMHLSLSVCLCLCPFTCLYLFDSLCPPVYMAMSLSVYIPPSLFLPPPPPTLSLSPRLFCLSG